MRKDYAPEEILDDDKLISFLSGQQNLDYNYFWDNSGWLIDITQQEKEWYNPDEEEYEPDNEDPILYLERFKYVRINRLRSAFRIEAKGVEYFEAANLVNCETLILNDARSVITPKLPGIETLYAPAVSFVDISAFGKGHIGQECKFGADVAGHESNEVILSPAHNELVPCLFLKNKNMFYSASIGLLTLDQTKDIWSKISHPDEIKAFHDYFEKCENLITQNRINNNPLQISLFPNP